MNDDTNLNPATSQIPTTEPIKLDENGIAATPVVEVPEPSFPVAPELPVAPPRPLAPPAEVEMPLAFAAAMPATPEPMVETTSSLPPIPPSPLPPVEPPKPEKKGFSIKTILAVFAGLSILGAIGAGAWYAYLNYAGEDASIAKVTTPAKKPPKEVDDKDDCYGCHNGGWLVWRDGACKVSGICDSEVPGKDTENPSTPPPGTPANEITRPTGGCPNGYYYCGGEIDKCVSEAALVAQGGGCNTYGEKVYGIPTVYGASGNKVSGPGECDANKQYCDCGVTATTGSNNNDAKFCFDKKGVCNSGDIEGEKDPAYYDKWGLCALVGSYTNGNFTVNQNKVEYLDCYTCSNTGCVLSSDPKCVAKNCTLTKYTCNGTNDLSCTDANTEVYVKQQSGSNLQFENKCGTVEQLDLACGDLGYVNSRSKINPPCEEEEEGEDTPLLSPSPTPVLMCKSLTKNKSDAQISVGTVVTLTCSGTVTPAGATSLSYKFRYNVNGGAWTALVNRTSTTAEFTVNQCGTYSAQCQTCGTINGAQVCDPRWSPVTVQ